MRSIGFTSAVVNTRDRLNQVVAVRVSRIFSCGSQRNSPSQHSLETDAMMEMEATQTQRSAMKRIIDYPDRSLSSVTDTRDSMQTVCIGLANHDRETFLLTTLDVSVEARHQQPDGQFVHEVAFACLGCGSTSPCALYQNVP